MPFSLKLAPYYYATHMMGDNIAKSSTTTLVSVDVEVVEGVIDLEEEMFNEVGDGVEVRSLLKTEDLRLIRRAFISHARIDKGNGDVHRSRELMKRMLRKVKQRR